MREMMQKLRETSIDEIMQSSNIETLESLRVKFLGKKGELTGIERRLELQRNAMTDLKVLSYFSMLAMEQGCILPKQYELISRQASDCQNLLGAWMNSDRKRLQS